MRTTQRLMVTVLSTALALGSIARGESGPTLAIPRLPVAPMIDGKFAPDEWKGAAEVTGMIDQLDKVRHARQASFWIGYDATNVYVAVRSTVQPSEWTPYQALWAPWGPQVDSSYVIGLAPGRVNRGDDPSHYTIRVSVAGNAAQSEIFATLAGVKVTFPHPPIDLHPAIASTFNTNRTEWTSEVAIPLAEMKVDAAKDGETWRVLFARDYGAADQTASIVSSDWKFWDRQGFWNMYRLEREWSPARLAGVGAAPRPVNLADGLAKAEPIAQVDDIAFDGQYDPILNRFYGELNPSALSMLHRIRDYEVSIRRAGDKAPLAVFKPKGTATAADAQVIMYGAHGSAAILEWRAPVAGVVSIDMAARHRYHDDSHPGERLCIQHVQAGVTKELMAWTPVRARVNWLPVVVKDVAVNAGDRIQFHVTGSDTLALRGLLTLDQYGVQQAFSPGGELTATQGGASGTWFYQLNEKADTLNPKGEYPQIEHCQPQGMFGGTTTWITPSARGLDQGAWWRSTAGTGGAMISRDVVGTVSLAVDEELPALTPGVYRAEAVALDQERKVLARAWRNFIRYDHATDMPWIGNKLGISDKVQPPWIPVSSEQLSVSSEQLSVNSAKKGPQESTTDHRPPVTTFSVWGREYRVDGSGLLTGLEVAAQSGVDQKGVDILAGPVRMELVQDGKLVVLKPEAAPAGIKVADAQASWSGVLSGGGWRIETSVALEYDGYALHRITIEPPAEAPPNTERRTPNTTLDSLRLVIPLKREYATQLHAVGGGPGQWFRHSVNSLTLDPAKIGQLWHSGQNSGLGDKPYNEEYGVAQLAGNFRPYVWLGGATRGLAFMADNDKDWVPADKVEMKHRPSIEVVRGDDGVALVLNLVARPFAFDRARMVEFSLQATPIRPVNPDCQARLNCLDLRTAFTGTSDMVHTYRPWDWNGMRLQLPGMTWAYIGYMHGPHAYPIHWDAMISSRQWFEGGGRAFTPYQMQASAHVTDVDDPRMPPGKRISDVWGYIDPHVRRGNLDNALMAQEQIDYRLWCYDAWIRGTGISGLYFDITEPRLDANVLSGSGYVLDLPDRPELNGKVQPGFSFTRIRQFYKRLRQLFLDQGHEQTWIFIHSTDGNMVSAHAFVDYYLEGENNPELTPEQPWFSKKYAPGRMQALGNPAGKWGVPTRWLDQMSHALKAGAERHMAMRSLQGYCRLHDLGDNWNGLSWAPFDPAKPMTFYPYWDPQVAPALKCETPEILTSAHRQDNRLEVLVFNRFDEPREGIAVRIDAATLGLKVEKGQTLTATDLDAGGKGFKGWEKIPPPELPMAWTAAPGETSGTLTVSLRAHDYRIILIEAQDTKQP